MADLIGAMERLWFHQIILVPEPTSPLLATNNLSNQSLAHNCMDDSDIDRVEEQREEEGETSERPTRLKLTARRARSHSSLPATQAQRRPNRHPERAARLEKSMSCRSFRELELEELKGFMDLGFKFKKEHLSPRLLRVIPGLQRLGLLPTNDKDKEVAVQEGETLLEEEEEEEEDQSAGIIRPYLSESWLIRQPDSPLLNLRLPRVTAASDMKKQLRFWARTVASVVQQ